MDSAAVPANIDVQKTTSNKTKYLIGSFLILFVIVVVVIAILITNSNNKTQVNTTFTPPAVVSTPVITSQPVVIESDFKTFTSTQAGFSIDLPKTITMTEQPETATS